MTAETTIPVVQLVIFIILFKPSLYVLWKHGRHGILGWISLQLFCAVRVAGSILQIIASKNHSSTSTALLVSSIGLSPLLLSNLGILHEARRARIAKRNARLEWFFVIQYHVAVTAAIVLVIVGVVDVMNGKIKATSNSTLTKIGMAVIIVCWVVLFLAALVSMRHQSHIDGVAYAYGSTLLHGVLVAMPFVGMRMVYGVLSSFLTDPHFAKSTAAKIVLSVIPEVIVTVALLAVGIITRNMWKSRPTGQGAEIY